MLVHVVRYVLWIKGLSNDAARRINKSCRLQASFFCSQICLRLLRGLEEQLWNTLNWDHNYVDKELYREPI
jgi:hypothetical protein